MTEADKEKALFQIGMMKAFFAKLHLNLPAEMLIFGSLAFDLENLLLRLEDEIRQYPTDKEK